MEVPDRCCCSRVLDCGHAVTTQQPCGPHQGHSGQLAAPLQQQHGARLRLLEGALQPVGDGEDPVLRAPAQQPSPPARSGGVVWYDTP